MADQERPNGKAASESPAEAIERLAGELDGVRRHESGKTVEFDRAGVVFATREAGRLSFRLRAEVVEVALRTPETAGSARGSHWVALTAAGSDAFTVDRAAAWFESAWRLAGELPAPGGAPN
jgi:photosystem II stability/assembly factor-like uncharacterized protein